MAPSKGRRPLWQWLLIILLNEIAIIFLVVPGSYLDNLHTKEMEMLKSQLGEEAAGMMHGWAEKWFQSAFVDTGAIAATERFFEKSDNPRDPFDDRGMGAWVQKRTEVLWLALRYGFYRWGMFLLWLPLLVAAVLPVSMDAAYQRDIRKYQFSHTSGLTHKNSLRVLSLVFLSVAFMPLLPVSVPPLAIPAVMLLGLMAWWVYWANMQKRL
jgi:hypothetical protein